MTKPPHEGSGRTRVRRLLPVAATVLAVAGPVAFSTSAFAATASNTNDVARFRSAEYGAAGPQLKLAVQQPVAAPTTPGSTGRPRT